MKDIQPEKLIKALSEELKKYENIKPPTWAYYVKTGVCSERPPEQPDFWYLRSAAILRKIYLKGPLGVQRLRVEYGGKRRRGCKPAHFKRAGGKIIRLILQQLEKENLIKKSEKVRKGRIITPKGQKLVDKVSRLIK